ncbi:MAG: DUF58 domain-containing protein [bacterium]
MKKTPYLEQKVLDKLSRIPFKSKKRLINLNKGFHKSSNKGKNIEFKEHREYTFGDNIKDIDWKIYAKTEDYFIKEFKKKSRQILLYCLIQVALCLIRSREIQLKLNMPNIYVPLYLTYS